MNCANAARTVALSVTISGAETHVIGQAGSMVAMVG